MKTMFVMALLLSTGTLSAAETPVSVESYMSNGALSFKLENYSKETGYDCVISYDIRTYDDDHAYVRTAANLQTKTIYVDKKSTKRIKADFELQENEKMADFAHAVKAPHCVPATKSRAVLLKDYYVFDNYVEESRAASKSGFLGIGKSRGLILKADFKDIAQFEIIASKEVDLGNSLPTIGGMGWDPEMMKMHSNLFELFFINDVKRNILVVHNETEFLKDSINNTATVEFYYSNKANKIEKFMAPEGKACGIVLSTDYLICVEQSENAAPVFFNPRNNESLELDPTGMETFKDSINDQARCDVNMQLSLAVVGDQFRLTNRCMAKNNELLRFDIYLDKEIEGERNIFKFSSYDTTSEENLKLVDIRKEFPWAPFMPANAKDPSRARFVNKEKLDEIIKRLFKKTPYGMNIINTGKEEYFDVFFSDNNLDGYFGRVYWNEIK